MSYLPEALVISKNRESSNRMNSPSSEQSQSDDERSPSADAARISLGKDNILNAYGNKKHKGYRTRRDRDQDPNEIAQRTNRIVSDYKHFLEELDKKNEDDAINSSSNNGGDEEIPSLEIPVIGENGDDGPLQRKVPVGAEQHLDAIPENSPMPTHDYTDREYGYCYDDYGKDYDKDRERLYRYRMFYCCHSRKCRSFAIISVAIAALIGVAVSFFSGKDQLISGPSNTLSSQDEEKYQTMAIEFKPTWFGRNTGWDGKGYIQAYRFCATKGSRIPCPYKALCPLGAGHDPLGGIKNEPDESWAPISDSPNEWVQVGRNGTCELYSTHNGDKGPDWGMSSKRNEEATRHIMCCQPPRDSKSKHLPSKSAPGEESQSSEALYKAIAETLHPLWFDRSVWKGTSYLQALHFCSEKGQRVPCSYTAVCPLGVGHIPLGGIKDEPNGTWAPVTTGPNEWVQVGKEGTCELYSSKYGSNPAWGLTGEENEEITRHIMCCLQSPSADEDGGVIPEEDVLHRPPSLEETDSMESTNESGEVSPHVKDKVTNASTPSTGDEGANDQSTPSTTDVLQTYNISAVHYDRNKLGKTYQPIWFTRSQGWSGTTYAEGSEFCEILGGNHVLCPYEAYCPDGVGREPVLGARKVDGRDVLWAPVNVPGFEGKEMWVSVGKIDKCAVKTGSDATIDLIRKSSGVILCCKYEK